jgi:site-specific recombinase XerD
MTTLLEDAAEAYHIYRDERHLSPATRRLDRYRLSPFLLFCRQRHLADPHAVTARIILDFLVYLERVYQCRAHNNRTGRLDPATRVYILQTVSGFFAFLVRDDRILASPLDGLDLPRPRARSIPRWVRPREIDRLVAATDPDTPLGARDRAVIEILFGCGLRRAELLALDVPDVDLAGEALIVRRGKGGRARTAPLAGAAWHALVEYLDHARPVLAAQVSEPALLVSVRGRRLDPTTLVLRLKHLARTARLGEPATPHAFRHGYATALVRGGADLRVVQDLLGHRSLAATEGYTHLSITDLTRVHRRTHPRERRS